MYSHYLHPLLVDTIIIPETAYPQLRQPAPPFMLLRLSPQPLQAPLEPVPSATDMVQTLDLPPSQLAEFASVMVMLMWHERRSSILAMHSTSRLPSSSSSFSSHAVFRETQDEHSGRGITHAASPSFKNFSRQILHATQLSDSVVMLSLKYVAMAIHLNPGIQGADGSEYRVFTVALMLASKYLDDNTFTNKTWSEVTGMALTDLNSMETEFLDVLEYNLFVNKDEFGRWKTALVQFRNWHQGRQPHKPVSDAVLSIPPPQHRKGPRQIHCRHYTFSKQPQFASTPPNHQTPARVPLKIPPPSTSLLRKPTQNPTSHTSTDHSNEMAWTLMDKSPSYSQRRNSRGNVAATAFLSYNALPAGQYVPTYPVYHHQDYLTMAPTMKAHYAGPAHAPSVHGTTYYIDPSVYAIPAIPSYGRRTSSAATPSSHASNRTRSENFMVIIGARSSKC